MWEAVKRLRTSSRPRAPRRRRSASSPTSCRIATASAAASSDGTRASGQSEKLLHLARNPLSDAHVAGDRARRQTLEHPLALFTSGRGS